MKIKKLFYKLDFFILLLIIFFSYLYIEFNLTPSPDAQLYFGVANNIFDGIGYYDTIRNDEILPSIGYPIILVGIIKVGISGLVYSQVSIALSLTVLYIALIKLNINRLYALILIFIFILVIPSLSIWSIELGLIFSLVVLFYYTTQYIQHPSLFNFILLIISLLLVILIRPILLPFLYLGIPFILFAIYKFKAIRKQFIIGFGILFISIISIYSISIYLYKDSRLISGTYSAIPLYCAWNPYLRLTKGYTSNDWQNIEPNDKDKVWNLFYYYNNWEERDSRIKKEIAKFILMEPIKAINGYLWRLIKYTIYPSSIAYLLLFYLWVFFTYLIIKKFNYIQSHNKYFFTISFILVLYVILITSVFIFTGNRYYITPSLFLLFSIAINIYILKSNKKIISYYSIFLIKLQKLLCLIIPRILIFKKFQNQIRKSTK